MGGGEEPPAYSTDMLLLPRISLVGRWGGLAEEEEEEDEEEEEEEGGGCGGCLTEVELWQRGVEGVEW